MKKTVEEIMQELNLKRGTVENFRSKLLELKIISNNQSLDDSHVEVLRKIGKEKEENNTWEDLMYRFIYSEYADKLKTDFCWQPKTVIDDLIWQIEQANFSVESLNITNCDEDFHIFCCIIDNFSEQGKVYDPYKNSQGTDGNAIAIKVTNNDSTALYYIIGKLNAYTEQEDIHVFYNDSKKFNIMKTSYIGGGDCEKGIYRKLREACNCKIRM